MRHTDQFRQQPSSMLYSSEESHMSCKTCSASVLLVKDPIRIIGAILLLVIVSAVCAQTTANDRLLTPVRKDLVALRWPDLTKLEESVREQIVEFQDSLAATAKDPAIS